MDVFPLESELHATEEHFFVAQVTVTERRATLELGGS
jgi:hypothetical protein